MSRSVRKMWKAKLEGRPVGKSPSSASISLGGVDAGTVVLGVDPSLRGTGVAVVKRLSADTFGLMFSKTIKIRPKVPLAEALGIIATEMDALLSNYTVQHAAFEGTIFVQNYKTAHTLGAARGAAIGIVARHQVPIAEYAPLTIKRSVVGSGKASKQQVASMTASLLSLENELALDESDAAACAICHAFRAGR